MPSDTTTAEFQDHAAAPLRGDRPLPAGAGLAIGVLAGSAFWLGLAAFLLL